MTRFSRSGGAANRGGVAFHSSCRRAVEALERRVLLSTFIVVNTADSGPGSLRQAILDANAHVGIDTIAFGIPGVGVQTIAPASALPAITDAVTIDGTTQPGYSAVAGAPVIELSGAKAGAGTGLVLGSGQTPANASIVKALIIDRFAGDGILIQGSGDQVKGCYIGLDAAGDAAAPKRGNGITVAASQVTIGGSTTADRNVVSGNRLAGINQLAFLSLSITGNYVGTNAIGTAAVANGHEGVRVLGSVTIGGAGPLGNVISGNGYSGIYVGGTGVGGIKATILGNYIGTNAAGTAAVGNGTSPAAPYRDGVTIASGGIHVGRAEGAATPVGNVISGNEGAGIAATLAPPAEIEGNLIGTDATGNFAVGNSGDGIICAVGYIGRNQFTSGASILAAGGNVISGNRGDGVLMVAHGQAIGVGTVAGNYIGTNLAGSAAIPNSGNGVEIQASNVSVGMNLNTESSTGAGNVISGNGGNGILVDNPASGGQIVGIHIGANFIGTDASGNAALGNSGDGILIEGGVTDIIGGLPPQLPQVISANGGAGISVVPGILNTAGENTIEGNLVGTNLAGTSPLGNGGNGMEVFDKGETIRNNLVSANHGSGIYLGESGSGSQIYSNKVGTNAAGVTAAGMGNASDGVTVFRSSSNFIGSDAPGGANVIAGNGGNGVTVDSGGITQPAVDTATFNRTSENSIFSNGGLGIDLGNDGVTPNHPGGLPIQGPNSFQDFPVILSAVSEPQATVVRYQLVSPVQVVQFFTNVAADPSGYGEGQTFVGTGPGTGQTGQTLTATLPNLPVGTILSATAIGAGGNTSEFSQDVTVIPAPPTVTHAAFDPQTNTISFTFSKDVSASLSPSSVRVHNQTTGQDVAVTGVSYDPTTNAATFQLPGNLPGGSYVATLLARAVTDSSGVQLDGNNDGTPGDDYTFQFSSTSGDVNLDGAVSFDDLLILASHFGQAGTFAQGDLNHDGSVDFADLLILAQGYAHRSNV